MDSISKGKNNPVKLIEPVVPKQLKIMIIGDSGVGKSSFIGSFLSDGSPKTVESTHGVDIFFKKIKIKENVAINYAIWDLSGKEEYTKIRTEFYGELFGLIYMFDHSKTSSFTNIESMWMKEVKKNGGDKLVPCLIGNKTDLPKEVPQSSIDSFIAKYKMSYFDVSSKTNENLKKAFLDYGTQLYETLISREQKKK